MTAQLIADLKAARELIADPMRWTQGHFARSIKGRPIGAAAPGASCWCAIGAIMKVTLGFPGREMAARGFLEGQLPFECVSEYNDRVKHRSVLRLFSRAIATAESKQ